MRNGWRIETGRGFWGGSKLSTGSLFTKSRYGVDFKILFSFNPHPRIYLLRERERERNFGCLPPICIPTGD